MVSSGRTGSILAQLGHEDPVMYNTGLGYTSSACLGLALARPDLKVVAIEGDGAMLAGLSNLVTIGRYAPKNLVVLVVDNGRYLSSDRGEFATASRINARMDHVARAVGFPHVLLTDDAHEFEAGLVRAMEEEGPHFLVAQVDQKLLSGPPSEAEGLDRLELALAFQRAIRGTSAASPGQRESPVSVAQSPGPGRTVARAMYQALIQAGIDFFVSLPDSVLYPLQELGERDNDMLSVCCTREDEGVSIASGAAYAGRWPVLVMEGTGTGMAGLALAGLIVRRTPLLIISSHSQVLGIRAAHDNIACMVNEPILAALNIQTAVVRHASEAALVLREAQVSARVLKSPVAVVVPPYVMNEPLQDTP